VHFVFLLLVPPNQTGEHLALLSSIAHWLTTPGHADRLRYAEGSDALSAVLAPAGT
jgi:mannitol/fructose-specific phosphotransferase system IIA component (Ntr-type)